MRGGCGGARGFLNSFNHATMLLIIPAYSHQTVSYLLTRTTQPDAAASLALALCATSCTFSWATAGLLVLTNWPVNQPAGGKCYCDIWPLLDTFGQF